MAGPDEPGVLVAPQTARRAGAAPLGLGAPLREPPLSSRPPLHGPATGPAAVAPAARATAGRPQRPLWLQGEASMDWLQDLPIRALTPISLAHWSSC